MSRSSDIEESEYIDQKVGIVDEQEVVKQDNNSNEIYQAKLKHLNKCRILNKLAYDVSQIKSKMFEDCKDIVKVYELIFKSFSGDKRVIIYSGKEDGEDGRVLVLATNGKGIGYARLWRDEDGDKLKVGDNLSGEDDNSSGRTKVNLRLDTINHYQELLNIMRLIGKNYTAIEDVIKNNYTDMKLKRFQRFFTKAANNIEFLNMPKKWGENNKKFDVPLTYEVVENGHIDKVEIKAMSFDENDTNTSERVTCRENDGERSYYSRNDNDFAFHDLQRIEPIFKEVLQALRDYLKTMRIRGEIINGLKNEIKEEFARELVYDAFSKDEVKEDG